MHENEISKIVLDASIKVHSALGPGLLESVYEAALAHELERRALRVERQKGIPVVYEGKHLGEGFRADLIVEGKVIIEIKSVVDLAAVHKMQILTYLKLSGLRLGLLINFNVPLVIDGYDRVVNKLTYP